MHKRGGGSAAGGWERGEENFGYRKDKGVEEKGSVGGRESVYVCSRERERGGMGVGNYEVYEEEIGERKSDVVEKFSLRIKEEEISIHVLLYEAHNSCKMRTMHAKFELDRVCRLQIMLISINTLH